MPQETTALDRGVIVPGDKPQSPSSCLPKEPFIRLGDGTAPTLDYNLPQSTCFPVNGYIPIQVPEDWFTASVTRKPDGNYWDKLKDAKDDANPGNPGTIIRQELNQYTGKPTSSETYLPSEDAGTASNADTGTETKTQTTSTGSSGTKTQSTSAGGTGGQSTIKTDDSGNVSMIPPDDLIGAVEENLRPLVSYDMYGDKKIEYLKEPSEPRPQIVLVQHVKVCSFLGNYGAGKTLKTFSLLPGEETEISVKTYKHIESVKSKAENVLDSFSKSSTQEMERLIEEENTDSSEYNRLTEDQKTHEKSWKVGGSLGFSLAGIDVKLDGGTNNTTTTTESSSLNEKNSQMAKTINSALDRHTAQSSSNREIQINTETTDSVKEGEDTSTTRKLVNKNWSRTLNFAFRQLLQEYITITHLEDVSIVFSNGYPESKRAVKIDQLESLLSDVLKNENQAKAVKDSILAQLCSIYDYQGTKVSLLEEVTHRIETCCGDQGPYDETYCRVRKDLTQTWNNLITVKGIILNVQSRILRTDSVIVDSLLGQGEALDCYNQRLQEQSTRKAEVETQLLEIEVMRMKQAMQIIDQIPDPEKKAELYKDIFGDCCPTAQTQIIN